MELHIESERSFRNKVTGRFLRGNIPVNKGQKWEDFYSEDVLIKMKDHLSKLHKMNKKCGWVSKKVKVIAVNDGKHFFFPSAKIASQKTGANHGHIIQCCRKKAKTCGGFRWFYENDEEWIKLISK